MYVASCYARVKHNSGVLHVFLLNTIILSNLFNTSFLIKFSFIWRYKFISPSWLILYYCKCLFKNIWIEVSPFPYVLAIQKLGIYGIYCTHSSLCMFHDCLSVEHVAMFSNPHCNDGHLDLHWLLRWDFCSITFLFLMHPIILWRHYLRFLMML